MMRTRPEMNGVRHGILGSTDFLVSENAIVQGCLTLTEYEHSAQPDLIIFTKVGDFLSGNATRVTTQILLLRKIYLTVKKETCSGKRPIYRCNVLSESGIE
jgi:hypothetical protein